MTDRDAQPAGELIASLTRTLSTVKPLDAPVEDPEERRRKANQRWHLVTNCNVPEKDIDKLLGDAWYETESTKAVEEFRAVGARMLVLAGSVGVGKTFAACQFLIAGPPAAYRFGKNGDPAWPAERHARVISASEYVCMDRFDEAAIRPFKKASILVLDDLGMETPTDHALEKLDALIYARDQNLGWTIVTTNLTRDKLRKQYGARIVDRINGNGYVVDLPGESLRTSEA